MRTPIIAANWKMFKTVREAVSFAQQLALLTKDVLDVEIVLGPPFTALQPLANAVQNTNITTAAQDLYWEREGPYTGEVSAPMIAEAGATHVIIGHSERRRLFGETDVSVNRKIRAALGSGLTPIVCIGETLEERDANRTFDVLDRQVRDGFDGLAADQMARLVIAYEPVWAIGTGRNASPQQAEDAHAHVRGRLRQWFGANAADDCRVLYGGSVKPDNIRDLIRQPDLDGALVGGASLEVQSLFDIIRASRFGAST